MLMVLLAGCGKGQLLGPKIKPTTVKVESYGGLSPDIRPTVESATKWEITQGGLDEKTIDITMYKTSDKSKYIYGQATVGGEDISLFIRPSQSLQSVIGVLMHEVDHLRGKTHDQMPDTDAYYARAGRFLGQAAPPINGSPLHVEGTKPFECSSGEKIASPIDKRVFSSKEGLK